jgi:coenzyme F420 hydrogenase subunit beta
VKGEAVRHAMNGVAEAPGKTWFWELAAAVVDADRCVRCGACVAVCPSDSIGLNDQGLPALVKMCTGCSLCWDACPRAGLRVEALGPAGGPAPAAPDELGEPVALVAARAARRAPRAQDGGVVTAVLAAGLESGALDGALVAVPSADGQPLRAEAKVVTSAAELGRAAGSTYHQVMALAALDLAGVDLPKGSRLAVVGTPCVVQGLQAMQRRPWPGGTGRHRVADVVLSIALLCTKSFDYQALVLEELAARRGVDLERVGKVDVTEGRLVVTYLDGQLAVDEPVKAFHGAALRGCAECPDVLGHSADLAVGSVGSLPGWSTVLVRSEAGRAALDRARPRLDLKEADDPEALRRLARADRRAAERALPRPLEPQGRLWIEWDEHRTWFSGSDRAPVAAP